MMKLSMALCFIFSLLLSPLANADKTILTIEIQTDNGSVSHHFDREALEKMPQTSISTSTPWTKGVHQYSGPTLASLLKALQAEPRALRAVALNEYVAELDWPLLQQYPAILAINRNGEAMRIRHKGPIWIILPLDDYPELDTNNVQRQMVWQLRKIEVE